MGKSMPSHIVRSQVTFTTANSAVRVYAEIAAILDCTVYNVPIT